MMATLVILGVALVGTIGGALWTLPPGAYGDIDPALTTRHLVWLGLAGAAYLAGVGVVRYRPTGGAALAVILLAGIAVRLMLLTAPPAYSTDLYRYVWDGRVQAAGINPYRYIPADPALSALRDTGTGPEAIYDNINRATTARTIYPPAAQLLFALVGRVAPGIWGIKAAMALLDVGTAALLLLTLRAAGRPLTHVLVWAWNPLVIWEFSGAGHIDAMACAFVALALLLAIAGRMGWAGAALGVAIATKFLPAVFFPAIWRRWQWRGPAAALAVIVGGYAVYASAGWDVFGFLGGYTAEESLDTGSGFFVVRLLALAGPVPGWVGTAYPAAALLILAALATWVAWRPLPAASAARANVIGRGATVLAVGLIVLLSPHYPWYMTLLAVPAVLVPAWSVLWMTVAAPLLYADIDRTGLLQAALVFLPPLALLLPDLLFRPVRQPACLIHGGP
jgi:hypothetical protein